MLEKEHHAECRYLWISNVVGGTLEGFRGIEKVQEEKTKVALSLLARRWHLCSSHIDSVGIEL